MSRNQQIRQARPTGARVGPRQRRTAVEMVVAFALITGFALLVPLVAFGVEYALQLSPN